MSGDDYITIAEALQNAQQKVAAAYTAINSKGGTIPETQNLANLPTAINSIQSGILENLLQDMVDGNNPVDVTELQSVESQISGFLGSSS